MELSDLNAEMVARLNKAKKLILRGELTKAAEDLDRMAEKLRREAVSGEGH